VPVGLSNGYWLRAQIAHDIEVAERALQSELGGITPWAEREESTQ
jgi:hypothetical protein